jgi:hypothetical protein
VNVTFTLDGVEYVAQTVDVSKTGALFSAREAPSVGTRILLNLSDRQSPDLSLFLKATVVRNARQNEKEKHFAVEFGDAVAKDPKRLRLFLERVLSVSSGLIRVVGGAEGEERAYAFSFDSIHREGEERVKALQASLFGSFKEMEEADEILSNFGKMPVGDGLTDKAASAPSDVKITAVAEERPASPKDTPKRMAAARKRVTAELPASPAPPSPAPSPAPGRSSHEEQMAANFQGEEFHEESIEAFFQGADVPAQSAAGAEPAGEESPRPEMPAQALPAPGSKTRLSFLQRLTEVFLGGKNAPKGERLIQTQRLPTIVANNTQLPVVYRMGTSRYQGTATRLYCAGMKCLTTQKLPQLYAAVAIVIPLAGAKKISQIELVGDVTRVRGTQEDSDTGGVFEVRLSMRTDKMHLEMYRALLDKLTAREATGSAQQ